jgi:hypothetical protein
MFPPGNLFAIGTVEKYGCDEDPAKMSLLEDTSMTASRLRVGLFTVAVGCLFAFGATGDAAPKVPATHVPIVQELHQTKMLLNAADHDYDGFRAKAAHQVTRAIHALVPPHPRTTPKTTPPVAPGQRVREPQAVSDKQLQQAIQQLQVVLNQLGSLPGDARAGAATVHVRSAIQDLQTALKIK